jgi:LDH2 family malate/lactate/ureidoglycolate dehydrogenase
LTAGLANGLLCFEQGTLEKPTDTEGGSTKLFIAIKPFGDWLPERLAELTAHLKTAPAAPEQGEAQWPGEGSFRRRSKYLQEGILLPGQLVDELQQLAAELTIELRWA